MKIINPLFITFILTSFLIIKKCYSEPYEKFRVKDIYVEFNLAKNTANRKKAVNLAYDKALKRYLRWITLESNENISEIIKQIEPNKVIKGYSIENEKFSKNKYSALISVNFDKSEIKKLLASRNIKHSFLRGTNTLVIPLMKIQDRYILWDDPNPWFETWLRRPLDSNLTEFILPTGDVEDLITLSAEDAEALVYYKIKNITNKYNANQAIVLFLSVEENLGDYTVKLKASDGLSRKEINLESLDFFKTDNFSDTLFNLANAFADYLDDLWVDKNIKEFQESKNFINAEIKYESLEQWISIKKILKSNKRLSSFKILGITNKKAFVLIEILSKDDFLEEIEKKKLLVSRDKNSWLIGLKAND